MSLDAQKRVPSFYSARKAAIGLMRVALRAGNHVKTERVSARMVVGTAVG